ncbi:hypothetical protein [Citrobacter portucalensis]|uniref:hypothetical protein n=1 Tax=Citrobacter portucalensis TaxID=1639133 RepID=UPI00254CEB0F|nr:hypothetical protein [Citrobacter portucalensis]
MMQSYIARLAAQEAYSNTKEIMGYSDYLMNWLYDYADEHKKIEQTPAVAEMVDNLKDGE